MSDDVKDECLSSEAIESSEVPLITHLQTAEHCELCEEIVNVEKFDKFCDDYDHQQIVITQNPEAFILA